MTWQHRNDAAERARFVAIYGEALWDQIQALSAPKPLAEREVLKPRAPGLPAPAAPAPPGEPEYDDEWEDRADLR